MTVSVVAYVVVATTQLVGKAVVVVETLVALVVVALVDVELLTTPELVIVLDGVL